MRCSVGQRSVRLQLGPEAVCLRVFWSYIRSLHMKLQYTFLATALISFAPQVFAQTAPTPPAAAVPGPVPVVAPPPVPVGAALGVGGTTIGVTAVSIAVVTTAFVAAVVSNNGSSTSSTPR